MGQTKQITAMVGALPRQAQLALVAVALVTIIAVLFVARTATHTDFVAVKTGIEPEDAAAMTAALDEAKIQYQLGPQGTSVEVAKDQLSQARVELAEAGVLGGGARHADYADLLDKKASKLGQTSAEHELMRQRLLEGLVATDIERIQGVKSADVRLALPEDALFAEDEEATTAAITVDTMGGGLTGNQVKAIQQLTASAVKGLESGNVSIVDESGSLLTGGAAGGSAADGGTFTEPEMKLEVQRRYNANLEAMLTTKLEKIAGDGKVLVLSNADLNMDKVQRETKTYGGETGKEGAVASETTASEKLKSTGSAPAGPAGAGSNGANNQFAGTAAGSGSSNYAKEDANRTYSPNQIAEITAQAQGAVIAQNVSVVADEALSAETVNAIEDSVRAYLGKSADNNFNFSTAPMEEVKDNSKKEAAKAARMSSIMQYVKWALAGLGLLGMAFFMRKTLKARTQDLLNRDDEMLLLEPGSSPIRLDDLEAAMTAAGSVEHQKRAELQRKVTNVAEKSPEDVATMLRAWLHEGNRV